MTMMKIKSVLLVALMLVSVHVVAKMIKSHRLVTGKFGPNYVIR